MSTGQQPAGEASQSNAQNDPDQEIAMTRSAQLRLSTQAFCAAFINLAHNGPEKIIDTHFTSAPPGPRITHHGPPSTSLPFLGQTFSGRQDCLEYFGLLSDTLRFEPSHDTFPDPSSYIVDPDAVGPDDGTGRGVVCLVGRARFSSIVTGNSWTEQFNYRLSGFDESAKIGHWEIWADPLSAYLAVQEEGTLHDA